MAKSSASLNIVASDFTRAMREMAKITGTSFQDIIRAETKSILEAAAKKTQAAQVKLITARVQGTVARTYNGKTYLMPGSAYTSKGWKLPDAIWAGIQKQIKNSIAKRKEARGLAKKSWLQVAESLGISINVPAYVEKAKTTGGDYPQNATGAEKTDGSGFFIELTNSRTYSASVRDAIRAAMRGRTNFFKKNLRLGVFKKTSDIAAKYPGIKATA
jgi:hypothetical protein